MTELKFTLGLAFFIVTVFTLTGLMQAIFPEVEIISGSDIALFVGELIGIMGICGAGASIPIIGGLSCAGAIAVFGAINFFFVTNALINAIIFIPITIGVAYVMINLVAKGS